MHHLIPTIVLVPLIFTWLAKKIGVCRAFWALAGGPALLLLLAMSAERWLGYGLIAHALFHFSYDTSYVLTLIGLLLCLYFIFKGRRPIELMLALIPAVVPLLHLLLW
jgi:hypothetical protein